MLSVKHLTFAYTKEYNILNNINFELSDNQTMFIYGEAESGRTSLLRILLGMEPAFTGEVYYNNLNVNKNIFKTDVSVGFLPQKMACIENKSVYYNLEYVLKIRKINKALIEVKINNMLKCFGLDRLRDEKMKNLGTFDRLKVAIARLSLRKLDYIFVDDIFKDLPNSEAKYISDEINKLIKNNEASAIIVSDNLAIADNFKCKKYKLELGELNTIEE